MSTLFNAGCRGNSGPVAGKKAYNKPYLISSEKKFSYTAEQLKNKYGIVSTHIKNGFTAYRILYRSVNVDGKEVTASGAVLMPDTKQPLPLMNYDHGTYFPSDERSAPGYLSQYNSEVLMGGLFCAMGYLIVMPDYIGYGSTKDLKHPYCAYNYIAATCIDMLRATKEFCNAQNIKLNNKNFFTGGAKVAALRLL